MNLRDELRELGWDDDLIDAFEKANGDGNVPTVASSADLAQVQHLTAATELHVSGSLVATSTLRLKWD